MGMPHNHNSAMWSESISPLQATLIELGTYSHDSAVRTDHESGRTPKKALLLATLQNKVDTARTIQIHPTAQKGKGMKR